MASSSTARVSYFSDRIFCKHAWFRAADDLIEAMALLEPQIEEYWKRASSQLLADEKNEQLPPLGLVSVHMMLAGFAVENLCKGHLAGLLTSEEQSQAQRGVLPKSLKTHDLLALVTETGLNISQTETSLVRRLSKAVWRGRYAIPVVNDQIQPFPQFASDVRRTKALLRKLRKHVGAHSG